MTGTMISIEGLTKRYGDKRGIQNLSFAVEEGEVFGFLGPNGAGKTTTIRVLMALLRADSGRAQIAGLDCWQQSVAINRICGYLPGELALDQNLTGSQVLTYFSNLRGGVDQTYLKQLIERLGFDPSRKFRTYSTGNKRKLGLIQAFMHRPRLLILDEPTSGLDPLNQQEFERMVGETHADGRSVFVSSHILSEVEHICQRVAIIREGQLVRVGSVAALKDIKRAEVTISFGGPAPADDFRNLPGVEELEVLPDGQTLRLATQGEIDHVIKAAARHPVRALTSHEPSLEEIFLRYYTDEAAPDSNGKPSAEKEVAHVV